MIVRVLLKNLMNNTFFIRILQINFRILNPKGTICKFFWLKIWLCQKFFVPFLSSLRFERSAPKETVHSAREQRYFAFGTWVAWLIPLHLISGRPRPQLSPFEHSSLGTPYEKMPNKFGYSKKSSYLCIKILVYAY